MVQDAPKNTDLCAAPMKNKLCTYIYKLLLSQCPVPMSFNGTEGPKGPRCKTLPGTSVALSGRPWGVKTKNCSHPASMREKTVTPSCVSLVEGDCSCCWSQCASSSVFVLSLHTEQTLWWIYRGQTLRPVRRLCSHLASRGLSAQYSRCCTQGRWLWLQSSRQPPHVGHSFCGPPSGLPAPPSQEELESA